MFHSAFKKDILKRLFYSVIRSGSLDTNYSQVQGWNILCTFQSPNILLRSMVYQLLRKQALHNLVQDFWKKYHKVHVSSPWYMQTPKVSTEHTQKFFQPLNYTFMWTSDFYWYIWACMCLQKQAGVLKHSWKKIMQLLWTVVTYLLKNVEQGIEHDIDSTYGDI